jgi:murein DD-endopeptidase MepM/ murein hydrolase activator NlpD
MLDDRARFRAGRGWRLVALLLATMTTIAGHLAWDAERRSRGLAEDVQSLRARISEKRELIARQRQEMTEVAMAVDHLARTTTALGDRASQARRLAKMEQTRDQRVEVRTVSAAFDGGLSIVSEDTAHALEELAWLDGQAANAADSLAVLTAVLKERPGEASHGIPALWPVRGLVTSPFGVRSSPWDGDSEMHAGMDIGAQYGNPVVAAAGGEVVFAGRDSGYGGLIVIDHGSRMHTLYAHLSALYVRAGQTVRGGQPIGAVGSTGRSTGAHLHYEVRVNGSPVDPRRFLASGGERTPSARAAFHTVSLRRRG